MAVLHWEANTFPCLLSVVSRPLRSLCSQQSAERQAHSSFAFEILRFALCSLRYAAFCHGLRTTDN
jgi:hypothetical protein